MLKFSPSQYDVLIMIFGEGSVAWLAVGVISVIFGEAGYQDKLSTIAAGLFVSIASAIMALFIARKKDKKRK